MKICRIISQLDFGGVEQRLKLTSSFFIDNTDHELIILVLGSGGRICREIEIMGISVKVLNEKVKIPNVKLISKILKFLQFHNPDVIHSSGAEANFHGLLAGFIFQTPVRIGEEIGFPNHGLIFRNLFKFIYLTSHQVIAISKAVGKRLIELSEVSKMKITVVYNPVAISNREKALVNDDFVDNDNLKLEFNKIFVTTCRLVPIKNLQLLIQVFHEFLKVQGNENSVLWIIGEGPEKGELVKLTELYQISEKVVFFGFIKNVIPFLMKSDVFILPSLSEGFSISLVEAMLCGLPVISTQVGGPSEIITSGKNGLLFDPKNGSQLLSLMELVSHMTQEEKERLKKNAIERGSDFTVSKYGNSLLKLYYNLRS
ncbi:glycosyltransferase [Cyclobacterium sp. 1_MG-2023]|uniref:glycosyltransferase n=1 Tax=Cyclobacterium sp. 1_MG-2023 TaxID=3062681 RepID=UPI0026E1B7F4|nr:glycosyltransferase [Cyclobacterium sp. 1_MG-2023]MDO6439165.1 glycosyltransferase [Cyclobacterium sp. 1_MG-2023]